MTHSFLFFYVLPLAHFLFTQRQTIKVIRGRFFLKPSNIVLFAIPILYYIMRKFFWAPTEAYENYHKATISGAVRGFVFFLIGITLLVFLLVIFKAMSLNRSSSFISLLGWTLFTWGLFPYFVNESFIDMISVFAFRADWGSRHLLLTPLGAGFLVSGLALLFTKPSRIIFVNAALLIFACCNLFFGSQYFLDSNKKEQLVEIFRNTDQSIENRNIIFIDETKRFNGRYSSYRNTELIALVEMSGRSVASISGKTTCEQTSDGIQLTLKSKISYLNALVSRDLNLYFDSQEC
jgi:hypothetical protein